MPTLRQPIFGRRCTGSQARPLRGDISRKGSSLLRRNRPLMGGPAARRELLTSPEFCVCCCLPGSEMATRRLRPACLPRPPAGLGAARRCPRPCVESPLSGAGHLPFSGRARACSAVPRSSPRHQRDLRFSPRDFTTASLFRRVAAGADSERRRRRNSPPRKQAARLRFLVSACRISPVLAKLAASRATGLPDFQGSRTQTQLPGRENRLVRAGASPTTPADRLPVPSCRLRLRAAEGSRGARAGTR